MKYLLIPLIIFAAASPVYGRGYQGGYSQQCFREVYREEYVPGTRNRPGRVRRWTENQEVPCWNPGADGVRGGVVPPRHSYDNYDDNSCIEGSIIGGLLGGGLGGAAATQENWIWSIPAGVVGGALVGCQIDGG